MLPKIIITHLKWFRAEEYRNQWENERQNSEQLQHEIERIRREYDREVREKERHFQNRERVRAVSFRSGIYLINEIGSSISF